MAIPMEFESVGSYYEKRAPLSRADLRSNALWKCVVQASVEAAKHNPDLVMSITGCSEEDVEQLAVQDPNREAKPQDIVRLGLYVPGVGSKYIQQTSEKAYIDGNFGAVEFQNAEVEELNKVIRVKHLRLLAGAWMRYHLYAQTEPNHRGKPLEMSGEVIEVMGYGIRSYTRKNYWEKVGIRDWAWDAQTQENIYYHELDLVNGRRRAFELQGWRMTHPWSGGSVGQSK